MAFPCAAGTEKQCIFSPRNESAGGQIEDEAAIHFGVEVEIEIIEGFLGIAKLSLFAAAIEQAVAAPGEFVINQASNEVDGRHGFSLRLMDPGFQHGSDAAEAELPESTLQFNQIHSSFSLIFRSMTSR